MDFFNLVSTELQKHVLSRNLESAILPGAFFFFTLPLSLFSAVACSVVFSVKNTTKLFCNYFHIGNDVLF